MKGGVYRMLTLDRTSRYPDMDFHQYPTDETYRTASVETGNQQIKINEI